MDKQAKVFLIAPAGSCMCNLQIEPEVRMQNIRDKSPDSSFEIIWLNFHFNSPSHSHDTKQITPFRPVDGFEVPRS
jgi:hypothetical protein